MSNDTTIYMLLKSRDTGRIIRVIRKTTYIKLITEINWLMYQYMYLHYIVGSRVDALHI